MRVLDTAQMRDADRRTIEEIGIPSIVLMENAGRAVAAAIEARFAERDRARVAILCGRGNNGGDGLVVARVLAERGAAVSVFLLARADDVRGDARTNLDVARRLGLWLKLPSPKTKTTTTRSRMVPGRGTPYATRLLSCDLVVDAIARDRPQGDRSTGGFRRRGIADVNASGRSGRGDRYAERDSHSSPANGESNAESESESGSDAIEAEITVTLASPKGVRYSWHRAKAGRARCSWSLISASLRRSSRSVLGRASCDVDYA